MINQNTFKCTSIRHKAMIEWIVQVNSSFFSQFFALNVWFWVKYRWQKETKYHVLSVFHGVKNCSLSFCRQNFHFSEQTKVCGILNLCDFLKIGPKSYLIFYWKHVTKVANILKMNLFFYYFITTTSRSICEIDNITSDIMIKYYLSMGWIVIWWKFYPDKKSVIIYIEINIY